MSPPGQVPPAASVRAAFGWPAPVASAVVVLLIGGIDIAWDWRVGLTFGNWPMPLLAVVCLSAIAVVYRTVRPVPALTELSLYAALWVAFTCVGAINTYLAAALARPLRDAAFAAFDGGLGFDWVIWSETMRAHPLAHAVLLPAYNSLMPQLIGSIVLFALAGVRGRNEELLLAAAIGLLLTTVFFGLFPALGPVVYFNYGALHPGDTGPGGTGHVADYVPDLVALRLGTSWHFALNRMQGIVCLPSYHTVLAILLVHAHRGLRWSLPPVVLLNGLMLISIPADGGHYIADMAAGAVLALVAVPAARWLCRPRLTAAS